MIFRIQKTKDYTVMSNYHLKDKNLSLKAKGLLSWMLSNDDDWDYSIAGIVACCKEGESAINSTIKELQENGYIEIVKHAPNTENNHIHYDYNVYESPKNQGTDFQGVDFQALENQGQINTNITNTNKINNKLVSKDTNTDGFNFGNCNKPKKENLYSKCSALIYSKTDDREIQSLLFSWFDMLLEKFRSSNRQPYVNVFKGKLNMLDKFDKNDWKDIIEFNLQRGYEGFYPINQYSSQNTVKNRPSEDGVKSESYTQQELNELKKIDEERKKQGLKTVF